MTQSLRHSNDRRLTQEQFQSGRGGFLVLGLSQMIYLRLYYISDVEAGFARSMPTG